MNQQMIKRQKVNPKNNMQKNKNKANEALFLFFDISIIFFLKDSFVFIHVYI